MLRTFTVGFLGAVAALMVVAAVWFAVFRPIGQPGLVWGGTVYRSKQEFKLYLKSKGLAYASWLKRNPGVAPWEPGTGAVNSDRTGGVWDWKRDALLAVNAALLAVIAAALWARAGIRARPRDSRGAAGEGNAGRASPFRVLTTSGADGFRYVGLGATELTQSVIHQLRGHPGPRGEIVLYALAAAAALGLGLLISSLLAA
jgi:hypothetical protein